MGIDPPSPVIFCSTDWQEAGIPKVFISNLRATAKRKVAAPKIRVIRIVRTEWDATKLGINLWIQKVAQAGEVDGMTSYVIFNTDFPYMSHRYLLAYQWSKFKPPLIIVMTNPSTADHSKTDATMNRVIAFAKKLGFGGVIAMNVFSFRAREPEDVVKADYPIGIDNYVIMGNVIREMVALYGNRVKVIAAWGVLAPTVALKRGHPEYVHKVVEVIERHTKLHALELSQDGHPKHPLYLKGNLRPITYEHRQ